MTPFTKHESFFCLSLCLFIAVAGCSPTDSITPSGVIGSGGPGDATRIALRVATIPGKDGFAESDTIELTASVFDKSGTRVERGAVTWQADIGDNVVAQGARNARLTLHRGNNTITASYTNERGEKLQASATIAAIAAIDAMIVWEADGSHREVELPPEALRVTPRAINQRGDVAGSLTFDTGNRAFFWSREVGFIIIDTGEGSSDASDINDAGIVIGNRGSAKEGFMWSASTGLLPFRYPNSTTLTGINNSRMMAGVRNARAVRGTIESGFDQLALAPGTQCSWATAISPAGHVVGWVGKLASDGLCAYESSVMWEPDGSINVVFDCSVQIECSVVLTDVNQWGEIVGYTPGNPFRWTKTAGMRSLVGDAGGVARKINDRGEVAGTFDYGDNFPVVWAPDNSMRLLTAAKDRLIATAYAINNAGQVVGSVR